MDVHSLLYIISRLHTFTIYACAPKLVHAFNICMMQMVACIWYMDARGESRNLGKGGGGLINIFTTGGGYGRGHAPSRDSKGVWCFAPAAFLLLRLFSMKFTVISDTYISRDIRITRACMDSDEKTIWRNERSRKLRFVNFWISFRGTFHRECMAFLQT